MTFRHKVSNIVNSFVVLLDITVMINILQQIIKVLHEKILKVINLYWFLNDASEKHNSLNGHSNESRIKESVRHTSCQTKSALFISLE